MEESTMSQEIHVALDGLVSRLIALSAEDTQLGTFLRRLGKALVELPEATAEEPADPRALLPNGPDLPLSTLIPLPNGSPTAVLALDESPRDDPSEGLTAETPAVIDTIPCTLAARTPVRSSYESVSPTEADLPLIEARCRLKAEGARWAAERIRRKDRGTDFRTEIAPGDREIIDRAKALQDCNLWMNRPHLTVPIDLSQFEILAGCFEAVAEAVLVIHAILSQLPEERHLLQQALPLTAEAQSALREAVRDMSARPDADQIAVYTWVKTKAAEERTFIERFLRTDDAAEPGTWPDIMNRLKTLAAVVQEARARNRQRHKLFNKLRHLVELAGSDSDSWRRIGKVLDELVRGGIPPSNLQIRALMLPIIEIVPQIDDMPKGFQLVLRETRRFLTTRNSDDLDQAAEIKWETSEVVQEAARLLAGKCLLLIGGDARPGSRAALKAAFGLADVVWVETKTRKSVTDLEPYVARPDVAVVLLAIRWSSHSLGKVKQFCDRYDKPLVRLPAGYNPNQVAAHILTQCSERLRNGVKAGGDAHVSLTQGRSA
jgi:hypothetical protein